MPLEEQEAIRKKWHIITEGEDIPPPIRKFQDMRFPAPIIDLLHGKGDISRHPYTDPYMESYAEP